MLTVKCHYSIELPEVLFYLSLVMRKPAFCICENKDADQLCGNGTADQRLCLRYTLLHIPKTSFLYPFSAAVQPVCVGPGRKFRRPFFSQHGSDVIRITSVSKIDGGTEYESRRTGQNCIPLVC